ncbi:type II CRISPR-associated endonuclease Cas1 [Actinomycetaceae bacterium L2_0104]
MSTRWRILDCSSLEGRIKARRGALFICPTNNQETLLSTADIAVALIGPHVSFSSAVVHRLMANDIAVFFCDWKGVPEGAAYGWQEHGRIGARHRAQRNISLPRQKHAWAQIIRAKVKGQAYVLRAKESSEANEIFALAQLIRSGDPQNIEARAARIYWQALWGPEPFIRLPGTGGSSQDSTRNSQLDYAYTVLRGHGIRAVLAAGLSPTLGIFHHGRGNSFALVDDIIEPFRPAVDYQVGKLSLDSSMEDPEVRKRLVAASSKRFSSSGLTIPSALEDFAQTLGQYFEGEIKKLPVPQWEGPAL